MKRLISLALCCVIAASAFASCAQTPVKNYSPKITVSSSEADTYASWLTNRLGDSLENSVYLALGNDSGIDLSNFENDGYVIRTDGASAVIAVLPAITVEAPSVRITYPSFSKFERSIPESLPSAR